jgi:hypothetical protein
MARILTSRQFQAVYQVGERLARQMCRRGVVPAIKTPAGWRIVDPGPVLLELARRQAQELVAVPFIIGVEASQLAGISDRRLRQLAEAGEIDFKLSGKRRQYALQSLLNYMARRGRSRDQRNGYCRPWVVAWAKELIERQLPGYLSEKSLPDSAPGTPSTTVPNPNDKQT